LEIKVQTLTRRMKRFKSKVRDEDFVLETEIKERPSSKHLSFIPPKNFNYN